MGTPTADPGWLVEFHALSPPHFFAVLVCAVFSVLVFRAARRSPEAERRVRRAWAWGTFATGVIVTIFWMQPSRYTPSISWPLHLCDLAAWFAPWAMLSAKRWPKTVFFFWGLGLSSQAFFTPTLQEGPADPVFWLFWTQHLGVVGGALYLAVVGGYRPSIRDTTLAFAATLAVAAAVMPLNLAFGLNYMYTGNTLPDRPTVLDLLGPWPLRLVWLGGLVLLAYVLTYFASQLVHAVVRFRARP